MAAQIVDERQEEEEVDQLEQQAPEADDLPEKYKNKSVKEIVQMHQEAEKLAGRQSSEVGELRKVVDDFILNQTTQLSTKKEEKEVSEIDFFTDPQTAVKRAVQQMLDNDPRMKEVQTVSTQAKKDKALGTLQQRHPEMVQIVSDPKFHEWKESSKFRVKLYEQADKQFDYEAADELFTLWKERQSVTQQAVAVEQQARKQAVKSAATSGARGTAESDSRKMYRRADIIKLMKEDPDRYQAMSDEIMQAYAQGRVRG
jgi:uncharacterized protein YbaA (DUF1428 family)